MVPLLPFLPTKQFWTQISSSVSLLGWSTESGDSSAHMPCRTRGHEGGCGTFHKHKSENSGCPRHLLTPWKSLERPFLSVTQEVIMSLSNLVQLVLSGVIEIGNCLCFGDG